MASFLRENGDEVLEGNTYYWKISKLLEGISFNNYNAVALNFKLQSKTWVNLFVADTNGFVYVDSCSFNKNCQLFDLRTGIVGDDLQEIVAVKDCSMDKLISRSELDSILLSNKILFLFTEIRRKDETVQKMKDRKEQNATDYRDLLLSGKNSDVTLQVKNKKFYCHRCILAARSPVFAAMIKNDTKEGANGDVIIEDADPKVFQKFLLFLYTGKEDYINWENVTDLYKLADKYGMEDIKDVCRNDIKENIHSGNFCELFKLSLLYNDSELNNVCRDVLKENIISSNFCELFKLSLLRNDSELTKKAVQDFLKHSKDIIRNENWTEFPYEVSNKWLFVIHTRAPNGKPRFLILNKLYSKVKSNETSTQSFLRKSKDVIERFHRKVSF